MVLGIQVFGLLFSALILYLSFLYYKKKEFTLTELGFWALFTALFAIISLFPGLLDPIVSTLNLGRKLDLFIILGFMFLIATTYIARMFWTKLKKALKKLGDFNSRVILAFVYIAGIGATSLAARIMRKRFLDFSLSQKSYWIERKQDIQEKDFKRSF